MQIKRAFAPITITIESEEEAQIILEALSVLVKSVEKVNGSWWAGWKNEKLTPEQQYYRTQINKIRFTLDPSLKERPLFMASYS